MLHVWPLLTVLVWMYINIYSRCQEKAIFPRDQEDKQANEPMACGIGKLWAIYKKFGPLG